MLDSKFCLAVLFCRNLICWCTAHESSSGAGCVKISYFVLPPWCFKPSKIVLDLVPLKGGYDRCMYIRNYSWKFFLPRDARPGCQTGYGHGNSAAPRPPPSHGSLRWILWHHSCLYKQIQGRIFCGLCMLYFHQT